MSVNVSDLNLGCVYCIFNVTKSGCTDMASTNKAQGSLGAEAWSHFVCIKV